MFLKNKTPKPSPVCPKSFGRAELAEFGAESVATFASASWRGGSSSADPNGKSLPGVACFLGLYVCFQVFWKSYHLGWFEVPNGILKLPWWLNTAWATFQKDTNKSKKTTEVLVTWWSNTLRQPRICYILMLFFFLFSPRFVCCLTASALPSASCLSNNFSLFLKGSYWLKVPGYQSGHSFRSSLLCQK